MDGHFDATVVSSRHCAIGTNAADEVGGSPCEFDEASNHGGGGGKPSDMPLQNGAVICENRTHDVPMHIPIPTYLPNPISNSNLIECKFRHMPTHQSNINNNNANITINNKNNTHTTNTNFLHTDPTKQATHK